MQRNDPSAASRPLSALALTTPVAMGYIPLGAVFGFLFVQAGIDWWLAILASIVVFAGAAQYMMIPMIAGGLSIGTIALATLIVNLRHVFYGLSLLQRMPQGRLQRWYVIFGLTDETYSLLTTLPPDSDRRQMVWLALLNHGWWVLGSAIGALVGARAQLALAGLDFALVALFAVLAVEQWRTRTSSAPLLAGVLAYGVAWALAAQHALLLSIAICVAVGAFWQSAPATAGTEGGPGDR